MLPGACADASAGKVHSNRNVIRLVITSPEYLCLNRTRGQRPGYENPAKQIYHEDHEGHEDRALRVLRVLRGLDVWVFREFRERLMGGLFSGPALARNLDVDHYGTIVGAGATGTSFQFTIELNTMLNSPWFCQR